MSSLRSHLSTITEPFSIITPIEHGVTFPESLPILKAKYEDDIRLFQRLVHGSDSSASLLEKIRDTEIPAKKRMALLKIFRRCVSLICDTERSKKIEAVPTGEIVRDLGHTFKPIEQLKADFSSLNDTFICSLSILIGEYDTRGQQGYDLTQLFFEWFEQNFPELKITGPRGAGREFPLA